MSESSASPASDREFPCGQCGAELHFEPGASALKCQYCGHENEIPQLPDAIEEIDFHTALEELAGKEDLVTVATVHCTGCGAQTTREAGVSSGLCPFCGTPIVAAEGSVRAMKPKSLLPFKVTSAEATAKFHAWLHSRWFAPTALRRMSRSEDTLAGMYVPYWTYDCNTVSQYTGQRGDDYWVTESYTATENGKTVHKTRQVKRTRWRWVSGAVRDNFDDILVLASNSLPKKYAEELEPWDLENLTPFAPEYLSGFRAESYQVELDAGFVRAKEIMADKISATIRRDIGGDHQRISSVNSQYFDITFKHILLPIWISAYRFHDKVFRFLVNGRTGEVQGERPWSRWKIALTVIGILALVGTIIALIALNQK
jgi:predicted RNA-binding Zn-ribbon protein involved in translation (DUF1610 family)